MNQPASQDGINTSAASRLWYAGWSNLAAIVTTLGFSFRHEGMNNVPKTGPLLVLANHQSFLDPPLVGIALRRRVIFLARKTLFRNPFFGWFIRSLNSVPIDQEGVGKEGIRTVAEQLNLGKAVIVFPEGARTPDGVMHPFKPGVHLLIRKTRAPILPVGVAGAFDAWPLHQAAPTWAPMFLPARKGTVAVSIGKPFDSNELADMPREEALKVLFDRIAQVQQRAEKLRRK